MSLLQVDSLSVGFRQAGKRVVAVSDVTFVLGRGETVAIVGESGSGKSTTARAIVGLTGAAASDIAGDIYFRDVNITANTEAMRSVRGTGIGIAFQEASKALNPVLKVGDQLVETLRRRGGMKAGPARERAVGLLTEVSLNDPERVFSSFPQQLSGGMLQRVMLALALACDPDLLIADELTSGLDATVQAQILALLSRITEERQLATLFITHDLAVAASHSQRVVVMYGGEIIEEATSKDLFTTAHHPYTWGLLSAVPRISGGDGHSLVGIPGTAPTGGATAAERCVFVDRCPFAREICSSEHPGLAAISSETGGHRSRCWGTNSHAGHGWLMGDLLARSADDDGPDPEPAGIRVWREGVHPDVSPVKVGARGSERRSDPSPGIETGRPILEVRDLEVSFGARRGLTRRAVAAVDGVNLSLLPREIHGLVGESGSGKTTLARTIAFLQRPSGGELILEGAPRSFGVKRDVREVRECVQMVFQDPFSSLDPNMSANEIVEEPLRIHGIRTRVERMRRVRQALDSVRIPAENGQRFPSEFSGGQRQRIAIARALVLGPKLVVADEPVSALDVSVQAQILHLIESLRTELGIAFLVISHDLALVRELCDSVSVMYLGKVVERGSTHAIFSEPHHSYTRTLLAAAPSLQRFR